ncbi:hypothetical protein ACSQ67_001392 [Phaseolus vulgaris]
MTTIRRFCCNDLLRFSSVNLDHLTETFNMSFYMTYLARWPDYFHVAEGPGNKIMGYIMGKVEGQGESWHGHVTAVTVAPEYRRQQLAKKLMNLLEEISDNVIEVVEITKEEAHGGRSGCNLPHKSFLSPFLHVIPKEKAVHISKSKNIDVDCKLVYGIKVGPNREVNQLEVTIVAPGDKAFFVDLFVRASNAPAIKMYDKLGYVVYRQVLRYYSGEEDGLDMRKALSRDVEKKSIIPLKRPVTPDELEYD